jgi:KUP system potassium uptake protein
LLLVDPQALENPFYRLAPGWFHYGLIAFATLATVIASQAIISGAFSLTHQAIQLGFLPRMTVLHTASQQRGQIYVPLVNATLAVATLGAVVGFGSSDNLAGAYGVAVSLLMAITTLLAAPVAIKWGFNPVLVIAVNGFFLMIDLVFVSANSMKLLQGGWFPLLLAAAIAFLMLTWRRGQQIAEKARARLREGEKEFVASLLARPPARPPGTAAFLTSGTAGIPLTLTLHLKHICALHERVLLLTVRTSEQPRVRADERVEIRELAAGLTRVTLHNGFMEMPSVPDGVRVAQEQAQLNCGALSKISYYIGRETIIPTARIPGMWVWREASSHSCCAMPSDQPPISGYRPVRWWRWASKSKSEGKMISGAPNPQFVVVMQQLWSRLADLNASRAALVGVSLQTTLLRGLEMHIQDAPLATAASAALNRILPQVRTVFSGELTLSRIRY